MIDRPLEKEKWDMFTGMYRAGILNCYQFSSAQQFRRKRETKTNAGVNLIRRDMHFFLSSHP